VTGFIASDVTISGTAAGTKTATVTGSGATYTVAVKGMSGTGTVIATIDANKAQDALGNLNAASTSTDNSVTYDVTAPSVTINQAAAQADPSNSPALNFTAVFSEPVTGFATGDVTVSGTTGGTKTATVTGSGTTYNVAVTGMTSGGTVTVAIASARATDLATNSNTAATFTDNTVTYDIIAPTVTINKTAGQTEPLSGSPINFTVVFSETVTDFATGDVTITGAGTGTATVTGSDKTYNVAVSGMAGTGTVTASLAAGVAHDAAGNGNAASTFTDNTVNYTITLPTVTINQAVAQADPTMDTPVNFTVVFSKSVANFATGDVTFEGSTAPGTMTGTVTGSGMNYTVAVSGMTGPGTVMATLAAGMAQDSLGNLNAASTSTDNSVTYAPTGMPSWRQQYFGTNVSEGDAEDAADPNKNGIVNLLEYALGGDPVGGTTGTSILPKAGMSADGHLQLSLIRTLDRSDITLVVQGSSSMTGTWTDLARSTGGAAFTALIGGVTVNESGSGATRMVKIDDLYPTTDPAHPCRFMRLCVTNP
jgi:hypothetical protein